MTVKNQPITSWSKFKAKRKLAFGLILFHASALLFWLTAILLITDRTARLFLVSFWGLSIAGIIYTCVIVSPLMVTKDTALAEPPQKKKI